MSDLVIKIIPLDLAATLSPVLLALAVLLLGSKLSPRARTIALWLGVTVVGVVIVLLGFTLGRAATEKAGPTVTSSIVDIFLGVVFAVMAVHILLSKEREYKPQKKLGKYALLKWFALGAILSLVNFDADLLVFAAAREIGAAAVDYGEKIIWLVITVLFFGLPVWLPLVFYLCLPKQAANFLHRINHLVLKYSKYILFALFLLFAISLLHDGIKFLLGLK